MHREGEKVPIEAALAFARVLQPEIVIGFLVIALYNPGLYSRFNRGRPCTQLYICWRIKGIAILGLIGPFRFFSA